MLIGYFLDEVKAEEIFPWVEQPTRYEQSDLRHIPMPREGLLTEAYFYDAVLAAAKHDRARARARLQAVVDVKLVAYHEYMLARVMLAHPELEL
jgi:hypothetical protein